MCRYRERSSVLLHPLSPLTLPFYSPLSSPRRMSREMGNPPFKLRQLNRSSQFSCSSHFCHKALVSFYSYYRP